MMEDLAAAVAAFIAAPDPAAFEPLALAIHQRQRRANDVYRRYCQHLGVPDDLRRWRDIPGLPQVAFKKSRVACFPAEASRYEFRTSGTTGEGYGSHFLPSLDLYRHAALTGWTRCGPPGGDWHLLMRSPEEAPHSSLGWMGRFLVNGQDGAFYMDGAGRLDLPRLARSLARARTPVVIFGTALAFVHLLETPSSVPASLPAGSVLVETGGFKGSGREVAKEELYGQLGRRFGIEVEQIWNEYGMTEVLSQFYSRGLGRPHVGPPWLRAVVVDPETGNETPPGSVGVLRMVDLANVWSVVAVQTQDLAVAAADGGFTLLGRDPGALPRGCSRPADESLQMVRP